MDDITKTLERIKEREITDVQSGEYNWYEVSIALRDSSNDVYEHMYEVIAARNHRSACIIAGGTLEVVRNYENEHAIIARVRRLAYRGDMHPSSHKWEIINAGYYRESRG
jgi:hypothetical protein